MLNELLKEKEIREVSVLSICATYEGSDKDFEYWLGINDVLYKTRKRG